MYVTRTHHSKVNDLGAFRTFTVSREHHPYLLPKHVRHPETKLGPMTQPAIFILSLWIYLFFWTFLRREIIVCRLLRLASFTKHSVFEVYPYCSMCRYSIFYGCILVHRVDIIQLIYPIYPLMYIWAASGQPDGPHRSLGPR